MGLIASAREAEIAQLDPEGAGVKQDVVGLDVTVEEALPVELLDGSDNLTKDVLDLRIAEGVAE